MLLLMSGPASAGLSLPGIQSTAPWGVGTRKKFRLSVPRRTRLLVAAFSVCRAVNIALKRELAQLMSDLARTQRRAPTLSCPRCGTAMEAIVTIEPTLGEHGLIGYECAKCVYNQVPRTCAGAPRRNTPSSLQIFRDAEDEGKDSDQQPNPHMLRHGCGYAAWLGHKNIQHTVRYTDSGASRNLARGLSPHSSQFS